MYYGNSNTSGRRFFQDFGGTPPRAGMPPPLQPPPMGPPVLRGPMWGSGAGPVMGAGLFRPQFPVFRPPVFNRPLMNYFPTDNFETPSANMAANQRNCIGENRPDDYKRYDCFEDFNAKDEIKLDVELSSRQCTVKWWPIAKLSTADFEYCYEVSCQGGSMVKSERFCAKLNEVSLKTIPGHDYKFKLTLMKKGTTEAYLQNTIEFRAVFNIDEIVELYELARRFIGETPLQSFTLLYRCKPRHYFDDVINNRNGIMEKYIKDDNGHRASPINGKLRGLFFSAEKIDNKLPAFSPFGDVRITIPVDRLIRPAFVNLYFCDFYCNSKPHYVTVVICQKGSNPDDFCKRNAKPLDLFCNPFFRVVPKSQGAPGPDYLFFVSNAVHVEICYTENVPLSMGKMTPVQPFGRGSSRIGGLRNNIHCEICNLKKAPDQDKLDAAQETHAGTFKKEDLAISLKEEESEQSNSDPNLEMEAEPAQTPSPTVTTHLDFPQRYDRSFFGFLPDDSIIRKMHIENSVDSDEQQKDINDAVVKCVFSLVENTATELEEKPRALKILEKFSGNSKNVERFSVLFDKIRDVLLPHRKRKLLKEALEKDTAMQSVIQGAGEALDEISRKRMKLEIQNEVEIDLTKMDHEKQQENDPETVEMFEKFYESTEGVDIEDELHGEDQLATGKYGEQEAREGDESEADKTLTPSELDLTVVGDDFFASTRHHPKDPENEKEVSIEDDIEEIFKGLDEYDRKALERKEKEAAERTENSLNISASSCLEIDEESEKEEKLLETVKKELEMSLTESTKEMNVDQSGDQENLAGGEDFNDIEHDQHGEDKDLNDSIDNEGDIDRNVNVDDSEDQDFRITTQQDAVQRLQEKSKDFQDVAEPEVTEENQAEESENDGEIQVVDDEQQAEEADNSAGDELRASRDQEIINFIDSTLNAHQEQDEDQEENVVNGSLSNDGSQGQEQVEGDVGEQQNEDLDLRDLVEHEQGEYNVDHHMEEQKQEEEEDVVSDDDEIVIVDEHEVLRQEEEDQQVQEGHDQHGQDENVEVVEPENDVQIEEDGDVQIEENEDVQFEDRNQDTMDTADTEGDDVELDSESDERPDEMSEEDNNPVAEEVDTTNDGENDEVVIQDSEEEPQNTDDEIQEDA